MEIIKTAIHKTYGTPEVIEIIEIEKPSPKINEVLVKLKASSVTRADTLMRQGVPKFARLFLGILKPKNTALGTGFSGVIEAIGDDVSKFSINDEVFGEILFSSGANSEYVCMPEDAIIVKKPKNQKYFEAACNCDGVLTSYSFLKEIAPLKSGQHILINGASGSLGTAAVQLAKTMNVRVTAVCSSSNFDMVKDLGADELIDYKTQDFTMNNQAYDIIYDAIGTLSYSQCKKVLGSTGVFMSPVLSTSLLWFTVIKPKRAKFSATGMKKKEDLKKLLKDIVALIKEEKIKVVMDRTYALDELKEAHRYIETGRKKGNIAIVN